MHDKEFENCDEEGVGATDAQALLNIGIERAVITSAADLIICVAFILANGSVIRFDSNSAFLRAEMVDPRRYQ